MPLQSREYSALHALLLSGTEGIADPDERDARAGAIINDVIRWAEYLRVTPPAPEQKPPTDAQALALADLMRRFRSRSATLAFADGGLPTDWCYVVLKPSSGPDLHAGIDPAGRIST
jgi:hypothetical protein